MIKLASLLLCMWIAGHLQGSATSDSDSFQSIGERFFYIEENEKANWHSAVNICQEMGGHLADPANQQELDSIKQRLTRGRHYWLGISDLANEGMFLSQATGRRATFLRWVYGEPNNYGNYEHCVELKSQRNRPFLMNDAPCWLRSFFICERE